MDSNNLTPLRKGVVGVQFLFVAFGATVLVPLLVGLDPSTALFTAGIGTLIFHAVTRGKVPIFLGSSFAFIAPIIKATELYGLPGTLSGMVGVALVYFVMSALVKWQGVRVIERLFPPVVIGPVIILIGLSLAGTGVNMAKENWVLALLSLVTAVVVSMKAKGLLKLIPIFCGIIVGYLAAWLFYACAGIGNLVNNCIDLSRTRNIIIVSLTLTVGIGGAVLTWGDFSLSGIGLAALVGVLLNLILPKDD